VETFYDADGNPVKVVVHDGFTETDTNSVTGKTLPFTQTWVNTFDPVAGTRTVVGKAFVMTDPGKGAVIHDAGRVVFDAPFHVSFEAGHQGSPTRGHRSTRLHRARRALAEVAHAPFRADVRDPSSSRFSIRGSRGVHTASRTKMNPIRGSFEKYVLLTARRREPC
jgi:hypothetical protein